MDTGSHLLFGVTLAGLAYVDPAVAQHHSLAQAILIGTVIGSHAPDFDTLVRLKGYSNYLKHHRGITHSIPALFIWPAIITLFLTMLTGFSTAIIHVYLWTLLAVVFHVFLDMLNSYGVQSLRPFSKKWIHLDILSIFDPFLALIHLSGAILWLGGGYDPADLFSAIYTITLIYIAVRSIAHYRCVQHVKRSLQQQGICHVLPSFHWFRWRFVMEGGDSFHTGRIVKKAVIVDDVFSKQERNTIIQASMGTDGVRAFLSFAQRIHVTYRVLQDGYEVRWSDVRFWYDHKLPFGVDVRLDSNLNVVNDSLGWRKKAWDPPFV